jgi:hypothetical protein
LPFSPSPPPADNRRKEFSFENFIGDGGKNVLPIKPNKKHRKQFVKRN